MRHWFYIGLIFLVSLTQGQEIIGGKAIIGGKTIVGFTPQTNTITLAHKSETSCSAATTCAVTLTGSISTGDLLLIVANTASNNVFLTSADKETIVHADRTSGNGFSTELAYVLSAASASTPVTFTLTASSAAKIAIYDYTVSGSPALDAVNDFWWASGTSSPWTGVGLGLGASNCVALVGANSSNTITAVGGSWTDTTFDTTLGTADQVGVASVSAPAWTSSGITFMGSGAIDFCFSPSSTVPWGLMDSSGGTNGGTPSVATLNSSTFGLTGTGTSTFNTTGFWIISNNATPGITYSTSAHHALLNAAPRFFIGGTTYSDSGTVGLDYSTTAGTQWLEYCFPGCAAGFNVVASYIANTVTTCVDFKPTFPVSSYSGHFDFLTVGGNGGDFATMQLGGDGAGNIIVDLESSAGGSTNLTLGATNTWYKGCVQYNAGGTHQLAAYADNGTLIGTKTEVSGSSHIADHVNLGNSSGAPPTGFDVFMDKWVICYDQFSVACPASILP